MNRAKQKSSKRLDLQGIRGLSIIGVVGYHFFPDNIPNGYFGVDQFFVLSGFLMCMLLKRAENQSSCSLVTLFYSKRFKRLLPLHLLVILISMICLYTFFPETAIEINRESVIYALLFVSNRPETLEEDYSQMWDMFTHTWSLSVEIQFYFLVPFIFLFSTRVPKKFQYFYYGIVGFLSLLFSYSSSANVAFDSIFARTWQFLIGMVVYLIGTTRPNNEYQILNNEEDDEKSQDVEYRPNGKLGYFLKFSKPIAYISLTFLVIVTALPWTLSSTFIRPLVTICTGILMLVSEDNLVLSNKLLTYIGDISYPLYLIHWPVYVYWNVTCDGNNVLLICALISSIILAIATFETFEKWYLKLSSTKIGFLVVLLFVCNIILIHKDEIRNQMNPMESNFSSLANVTDDTTVDDAVLLNRQWSVDDEKSMVARFEEYEMARKRHTQLVKDCTGKCIMVDYVPEFYINATGTFRYFDERGFSYCTTPSHLSYDGIKHIRHVWTDICTKL